MKIHKLNLLKQIIFLFNVIKTSHSEDDIIDIIDNSKNECQYFNYIREENGLKFADFRQFGEFIFDTITSNKIFKRMIQTDTSEEVYLENFIDNEYSIIEYNKLRPYEQKFTDNLYIITVEYIKTLHLCYKDFINNGSSSKKALENAINQSMCFIENGLSKKFPSTVNKLCRKVVQYYNECENADGRVYIFNNIKEKHNQLLKAECYNDDYDFTNITNMNIDNFNNMFGITTKDNLLYDKPPNELIDSIDKYIDVNNKEDIEASEINNVN
ncbi:putative SP-containing protein [Vairimorpha necatrix]|uniref:SP-containing protein n=1 Tax=Vairimorpha necatrix TaxID=6039 RepID=A0AAX4JC92_9MICR